MIERVLVWLQIHASKQRVLFQHEIRDSRLIKHVTLLEFSDFLNPLEQEEQLCRQSGLLSVLIKAFQEGVHLRLFQEQVVIEGFGDATR